MLNVVVLVSGGGTNLQALIDAERAGELAGGKIACVISSKEDAYALERAHKAGIPGETVARGAYASDAAFDHALKETAVKYGADLIVLAGFLSMVGKEMLAAFENRIINVHPSLIPSFCGKGFYGRRVHEAALNKGVKISGATVHFVSEIPDGGPIILQRAVEVEQDDTPESLQRRIMEQAEWVLLPRAVSLFCTGRIAVKGNQTILAE